MKTTISSLNHVLTFQLEGMYEIVRNLQKEMPIVLKHAVEPDTKELLRAYAENLSEQRLKLKRIFSYLLNGPYGRKSGPIAHTIVPSYELSETNAVSSLRDVLIVTSMQAAIQFMIASYTDARYIAMRVEMDNVVRLLDEILDEEESFLQNLRYRSAQLVNNGCLLAPVN